jgi:hypothetical protein
MERRPAGPSSAFSGRGQLGGDSIHGLRCALPVATSHRPFGAKTSRANLLRPAGAGCATMVSTGCAALHPWLQPIAPLGRRQVEWGHAPPFRAAFSRTPKISPARGASPTSYQLVRSGHNNRHAEQCAGISAGRPGILACVASRNEISFVALRTGSRCAGMTVGGLFATSGRWNVATGGATPLWASRNPW